MKGDTRDNNKSG